MIFRKIKKEIYKLIRLLLNKLYLTKHKKGKEKRKKRRNNNVKFIKMSIYANFCCACDNFFINIMRVFDLVAVVAIDQMKKHLLKKKQETKQKDFYQLIETKKNEMMLIHLLNNEMVVHSNIQM